MATTDDELIEKIHRALDSAGTAGTFRRFEVEVIRNRLKELRTENAALREIAQAVAGAQVVSNVPLPGDDVLRSTKVDLHAIRDKARALLGETQEPEKASE